MNTAEKAQLLIECFKAETVQKDKSITTYLLFEEKYADFIIPVSIYCYGVFYIWEIKAEMKYSLDLFYDECFKLDFPNNYLKFKNFLRIKKLSQGCFND
jgi:hypothetical protein